MGHYLKMVAPAATVIACVWPGAQPAHAQSLTGERLYQLCYDRSSSTWNEIGQWLCPSYIRGIIDGARLQALHVTGSVETYKRVMQFCEPSGTTADAVIGVVVRFVENHPEGRPQPAAAVVYAALSAEWPCSKPER